MRRVEKGSVAMAGGVVQVKGRGGNRLAGEENLNVEGRMGGGAQNK